MEEPGWNVQPAAAEESDRARRGRRPVSAERICRIPIVM